MKPIPNFHDDVQRLVGSDEHTDPLDVLPLRFDYCGPVMVSCWKVGWRDLLRMLFTRKLWLVVMGKKHPPLFLETDKAYSGVDEWTKRQEAS